MISSVELQNKYIKLYECLRNYIWGLDTIADIANLEVAVYSSFPDTADITQSFNRLYIDMKDLFEDDEDLKAAANDFKQTIADIKPEDFYARVDQVQEVIQQEDI